MGKGGSTPDAVGAAGVQGEMSREQARDANYANRPDQINPWGNLTWGTEEVTDPASGEQVTKWTQNQNFTPDSQRLYDQQMGLLGGRGELAAGMNERVRNEMGTPVDWDQFGDVHGMDNTPTGIRQQAEDAAYGRATSRLDPRFEQSDEALEVSLRNKGLRAGDQAYDSAMGNASRDKNDAYQQAQYGATQAGMGEANQMYNQQMGSTEMANALRDQQIQETLAKRNFSLSEQNKLQEGQTAKDLSDIAGG
jgi:hypothetical protein